MSEKECEKINFWKLLAKYKISIPKIQRDYAQGRNDEKIKKIRDQLLDDLYNTITEKQDKIELDFIYGRIIKNENDEDEIQLLDGQQRLTTLFLIYWYIAKRTGELEKEEVKNRLKNFSYNNRENAADFCKKLVDKSGDINIENLLKDEDKLSINIKNKLWFFGEWNNEPTIVGMLNMLDAIHEKFKENIKIEKNIFERITEENVITMYLLDTKKYNLSNELYIKMNSRGKELSEYDKVKEKMIGILKTMNNKDLLNEFKENIETKWNEFFFDYYEIDPNNLDDSLTKLDNVEFLNFFYYITEMIYICKVASDEEIQENKSKASPFDENERFNHIEETYVNCENIRLLFDILNIMDSQEKVEEYMLIYKQMPMFFMEDEKYNVIDGIIKGKDVNYDEKKITFFYLIRLVHKKDNNFEFIRMMRNLILKSGYFDGKRKKYVQDPRYYKTRKDYEVLKDVIVSDNCYEQLNNISIEKIEDNDGFTYGGFTKENIEDEKNKNTYEDTDKVKFIENLPFIRGNIKNFTFLINETKEDIEKFARAIEHDIILTYKSLLNYDYKWIYIQPHYTYIGDKEELYHTFTRTSENDIFEEFYNDLKENNFDLSKLKLETEYKENDINYYFVKYYPEMWVNMDGNNILWFRKYNKNDEIKINWFKSSQPYGKHINVFLQAVAKRNNYKIIETTEMSESGIIEIDENNRVEINMKSDNVEDYKIVINTFGKEQIVSIDPNSDYIQQIENAIHQYVKINQ